MRDPSDPVKTWRPSGSLALAHMGRLTGRLWAIAPARLESLLGGVGTLGIESSSPSWLPESTLPQTYSVTESGIAVVPVRGPLVSRGDWLTALFGAGEYGVAAEAVRAAADDPAVRGIVLEIDSPGGEVGGLFDLVDGIGAIRQRSAKLLWAVASEAALSAAYAIASIADRLYVTRTGEVGSVGVVAVHVDESAADAMAGLSWTLIHAGARKTDGTAHAPLSPVAAADIQADVDRLYAALVATVAHNRGLSAETDPKFASCQGAMTVHFDGATLVAEAANGEPVSVEYGFSMAEGWQLSFEPFRVFLPKPKYAVSGPGGVEASFDWRAAYDESAGTMLRARLLNDVASYA